MDRRAFLRGLGATAGLLAVPPPVRRYWQVGALVGSPSLALGNSPRTSRAITGRIVSMEFGGLEYVRKDDSGLFVAVGDEGEVMTSPTGVTWTDRVASDV